MWKEGRCETGRETGKRGRRLKRKGGGKGRREGGRRGGENEDRKEKGREGGEREEEGRKEKSRVGSVLSAEDFLPCLYMVSSPPFFRLPSPDSDKNSEPPIVPAGWQTAPVTRTGGSHVSNCPQNAILMS